MSWHSETVLPAWCPFHRCEEFQKMPRGSSEVLTHVEKLLVRWKDNNVVTMATNAPEKYSEVTVNRWNKEKKAYDKVPQPMCIFKYNQNMGGVDLHDLNVSRYRATIRSKKWWWPIFSLPLQSAVVNSWLFFRDVVGSECDLPTFQRSVSMGLLKRLPLGHGKRSLIAKTVIQDSRSDGSAHWPVNTGNRFHRFRWCDNCDVFSIACEKCDAPRHIECFKLFHGV